jgi:hypothetical protein
MTREQSNHYSHCDVRAVLLVRDEAERIAPGVVRTKCSNAVCLQYKAIANRGSKSEAPRLLLGHVVTAAARVRLSQQEVRGQPLTRVRPSGQPEKRMKSRRKMCRL